MRSIALLVFQILISISIFAQDKTILRDWTSYAQAIEVTEDMLNSDFKASVYIRKDSTEENSKVALWTRVDPKVFFQNDAYNDTVIVTNQWKKFEIHGTIDSNATKLYVGAFVQNNGNFYFDDFNIQYERKANDWLNVPIVNAGFELDLINDEWIEGVHLNGQTRVENFDILYSEENPYTGKASLKIRGTDKNILGNQDHGRFASIEDVDLYYEIYGTGDTLLMIHGNGQSMSAFYNQVDEFSKHFTVITLDSRGRGKSSYIEGIELTYSLQVEDLIQFLNELNISATHIVGWSDGGILGLMMAIKYPNRVKHLVAMAANIFPEGIVEKELISIGKTIAQLKAQNRTGLIFDLYNMLSNYPQMKFEDLEVIKSKTLIIAGDHDDIKTEHTVNMFEHIPNAQLAILPNETHWMPEENPTLFNATVLRFLLEE